IADILDNLGHSLCKEIGLGENVSFIHCDVTQENDVRNAIDTTVAKHGKLDIMFNNAGISGEFGQSVVNCTSEDFKRVFDVNAYVATTMARSMMNVEEDREVEEIFGQAANLKGVQLKADDIAEAVLYLASDEAKYVSGLNLIVDGGFSTTNPILPQP
ncbi:hypothetical protein IFM89_004127, partial [Coptis chinensis]